MPKFLALSSYTADASKLLAKEGGSKRRAELQAMGKKLGVKIEAFYYAFGDHDLVAIFEAPDNVTAAAVSLAINAGKFARVKTVVLITPEEMDQASKVAVDYRPPGT